MPLTSKDAADLKRRQLIKLAKSNEYKLNKGPEFKATRSKVHASIDKEMIERCDTLY
jgi:hypothetical protein